MFEKYSSLFAKIPAPLLTWYYQNRREMAWREDPSPYHVWISEIMLQQTRVEAVRAYYDRFIGTLPDIASLAAADEQTLYKLWEGLGYYSRVRNLKKAAEIVMRDFGGFLPSDPKTLLSLPGIGSYTAGAIASIAFGKKAAAVDGNVVRVFARICDIRENFNTDKGKKMLAEQIETVMPSDKCGDFTQALMELGALICIPGNARCDECPLKDICNARKAGSAAMLPILAEKKEKKKVDMTVAVLKTKNGYLLSKRGESGLLAGMWQLWNEEQKLSGDALCEKMESQGFSVVGSAKSLGKFKHVFTHIQWNMVGFLVEVAEPFPKGYTEANEEALDASFGLPRAFSMILQKGREIE